MRRLISVISWAALSLACYAQSPSIVAHRGAWNCDEGGYARNSRAALAQSLKQGYWGTEFDVNMCADGTLLVYHDSKIDGRIIEDHDASEFKDYRLENGESIPTLEEFLEAAKDSPETMLVFELKKHSCPEVESQAVTRSVEVLAKHGLLDPQRVMFISFSYHICKEFARLAPGFHISYLGFTKSLKQLSEAGIDGIDCNYNILLLDRSRIKRAHELGMTVNCWTVNNEKIARKMIDAGVDLITTDDPEMVRRIIEESK